MNARTRLCSVADVPTDGMKAFDTDIGIKVLVIDAGGALHAFQGLCPHQEVCLDEGFHDGSTLTCHQHLWQWDIATGDPVGLAEAPLKRYEIEQQEGEVFLRTEGIP